MLQGGRRHGFLDRRRCLISELSAGDGSAALASGYHGCHAQRRLTVAVPFALTIGGNSAQRLEANVKVERAHLFLFSRLMLAVLQIETVASLKVHVLELVFLLRQHVVIFVDQLLYNVNVVRHVDLATVARH